MMSISEEKMKTKLCILFGGRSSEYEVSLVSSYGVLTNVDRTLFDVEAIGITKEGKWYLYSGDVEKIKDGTWVKDADNLSDVLIDPAPGEKTVVVMSKDGEMRRFRPDAVFPVLHGANGEDGTVQGLFEVAGVPFVGPDHTSSGICMDKAFAKAVVSEAGGIRQAKCVVLTKRGYAADHDGAKAAIDALGYPVFVKPARAGSSVGVTKVKTSEKLIDALERAFEEDEKVLVEEFIDGREIEVAVMESGGELKVSVPGEIDPGFEFYDYDTKYQNDTASYYIPARLDEATSNEVRGAAARIFEALGCETLSRVDFFVTKDGGVVFNEINTIPGFTPISMYPKLFIESGMTYGEVITALVKSALRKKSK